MTRRRRVDPGTIALAAALGVDLDKLGPGVPQSVKDALKRHEEGRTPSPIAQPPVPAPLPEPQEAQTDLEEYIAELPPVEPLAEPLAESEMDEERAVEIVHQLASEAADLVHQVAPGFGVAVECRLGRTPETTSGKPGKRQKTSPSKGGKPRLTITREMVDPVCEVLGKSMKLDEEPTAAAVLKVLDPSLSPGLYGDQVWPLIHDWQRRRRGLALRPKGGPVEREASPFTQAEVDAVCMSVWKEFGRFDDGSVNLSEVYRRLAGFLFDRDAAHVLRLVYCWREANSLDESVAAHDAYDARAALAALPAPKHVEPKAGPVMPADLPLELPPTSKSKGGKAAKAKAGVSQVALGAGGFAPTDEQVAIVNAARDLKPGEFLKIRAFAGAGKTTTLKLIAGAIDGPGCYCAFSKEIQLDSQGKFPSHITVQTINSIAFNAMGVRFDQTTNLNGHYVMGLVGDGVWHVENDFIPPISQATLVSRTIEAYCQSGVQALDGSSERTAELRALTEKVLDARLIRKGAPVPEGERDLRKHNQKLWARKIMVDLIPPLVERAWDKIADFRNLNIKIAHDAYLKLFELDTERVRRHFRKFSWVGIDEAQDLNGVMISIARKCDRPVIAVGDSFQQIFLWRSAEDALEKLPGNRDLYLSQSFRFGEPIARWAMSVLESKPSGGPPVSLRGSNRPSRVTEVRGSAPRVVICRSNAGVFREAVAAARSGRKVHVLGGIAKLSEEIESAMALYEGRKKDVRSDNLKRFEDWQELKFEAELLNDQVLLKLVEAVEESGLVQDLALLKTCHVGTDRGADFVTGTAHQAKGKEWPVVRLGSDFPSLEKLHSRLSGAARRGRLDEEKQIEEEWHVLYVAGTRAIDELQLPTSVWDDFMEPERDRKDDCYWEDGRTGDRWDDDELC